MEKIKSLGYDVIIKREKNLKFSDNIKDIEGLICYNPFDTLDISKLENLKWIQLSSIGIDQAPKEYIRENNIILTNNKGGYSIPMGEWVVLKILELIKNSKNFYKNQSNKQWQLDTTVSEIYGKTIGFIGTGSIAQESAKRLKGFGVNIIGLNTKGKEVKYFDKSYSLNNLKKMVSLCDVVIISVPYTKETHHMINKNIFNKMKEGVYLINIARGSIINESDMIKFIDNGKIKGAALDVFENEPLPVDSPLWDMENVIITPHNSWVSEMRNERRYNIIFENLKRYINNKDLKNVVNLTKGY